MGNCGLGNYQLWSSQDDIDMGHPATHYDDIRDLEVTADNGQSHPNDKGQSSSDSDSPFVNVHIPNLQQHAAHGPQPHTSRASTRVRGSHYNVKCLAGYKPVPYKHAQTTTKTTKSKGNALKPRISNAKKITTPKTLVWDSSDSDFA